MADTGLIISLFALQLFVYYLFLERLPLLHSENAEVTLLAYLHLCVRYLNHRAAMAILAQCYDFHFCLHLKLWLTLVRNAGIHYIIALLAQVGRMKLKSPAILLNSLVESSPERVDNGMLELLFFTPSYQHHSQSRLGELAADRSFNTLPMQGLQYVPGFVFPPGYD